MSSDKNDLWERVSEPVVPQEVQKDIAVLEQQFIRAEVEQLRQSILSFRPLFEKRAKIVAHPEVQSNFWLRVLSNAPAEIDEYITPADAAILGSLKTLNVERFEVNEKGEGEPRSIRFTFEFNGENPAFDETKLVKEFYWRKQVLTTPSGKKRTWDGLVSEPVRINWKKDMDVTKGLLDAACDLFEAEKKGGDRSELPEFEKLVVKLAEVEALADEDEDEEDEYPLQGQTPSGSFFNFFGYRGSDVTAEQSAAATKEENERFEKLLKGEKVDDDEADDDDEDVDDDFDTIEIFPDGQDLAVGLAEDLWPNALKYYVQSFEEAPDFDEGDLEGLDEESDDDAEAPPLKKAKK
ncbi:nucleosome assembly protein [Aspergillus granulosus]|uniref:Nucleosome assembly protein n=1 Tax=Aspergillus granulosus TaxID=176169 RepID=A0ABR4H6Z5_9EURO